MRLPDDPTPDGELLRRFAAGRCEAAFAELVRRHGPRVRRLCAHLARHHADDAFQATFLVLAKNAGRVRSPAVGSFLVGVAGRVAKRIRARERRHSSDGLDSIPAAAERHDAELARILADELAALPGTLRDPAVLCWLDGRTHAAAAELLHQSERTLRRRLERARHVLQARLARRGVAPAAAAGFFAGLSAAEGHVPEPTVHATTVAVSNFLAGGPSTPAAVLALGVTGMTLRFPTAAAVTVVAALATVVGVGFADDPLPKPAPRPAPMPTPTPTPAMVPAPVPQNFDQVHERRIFVTATTSPAAARALHAETEFQEEVLTKKWLGAETRLNRVRVSYVRTSVATLGRGDAAGVCEMHFEANPKQGELKRADIRLDGDFETALADVLPQKLAQAVVAHHFGAQTPPWLEFAAGTDAGPEDGKRYQLNKCREHLNAGLGLKMPAFFDAVRTKQNWQTLEAQGYAVAAFLIDLNRKAGSERPALLRFAGEGKRIGWDAAAKGVYNFDDSDALQAAWIEWLRKQPVPPNNPAPWDPTRIPPVKFGR